MAATILVCDNEEALRGLVRATLESDEYEIVEARDGDESVELAEKVRPDLIVLDMMMPGRTGLEVLDHLRAQDELRETPVVMLTARAQLADRDAATGPGADCFLPKPFSPLELATVVEGLLDARA